MSVSAIQSAGVQERLSKEQLLGRMLEAPPAPRSGPGDGLASSLRRHFQQPYAVPQTLTIAGTLVGTVGGVIGGKGLGAGGGAAADRIIGGVAGYVVGGVAGGLTGVSIDGWRRKDGRPLMGITTGLCASGGLMAGLIEGEVRNVASAAKWGLGGAAIGAVLGGLMVLAQD